MKRIAPLALLTIILTVGLPAAASGGLRPGHRLPDGRERAVRERQVDVQRMVADLHIDMQQETVAGHLTISFTPLRTGLGSVSLDSFDLTIDSVELLGRSGGASGGDDESGTQVLQHSVDDRSLRISLPRVAAPGESLEIRINYSGRPGSGLYFYPDHDGGSPQAWNYGEGGLHYAWLPLYNDTNDRFAVEFLVTVAAPHVVLSNGTLIETRDNADGTRTFHWVQEEEIPNYLLALNVGEFVEVPLAAANVGSRAVPVSVWTSPGQEDAGEYAFRNTPRMVEFFSERFGVEYPWPKYDQVILREFGGAMETTTMVGYMSTYERRPGDPIDSSPLFNQAYPRWTNDDTISHELAHHWFGDLVTCRSMASIWLNESFASFAHTVWHGHANGEDDLTYQRWRYLDDYLGYVHRTGEVRPLEYFRYDIPNEMYQEETTYVKGALVLHMLRHFVGDDDFYRTLSSYLKTHAYSSVESADLQSAFEAVAGRNLSWFFSDWIVGGGGHPALEAWHSWSPERHQVDLTVRQVQADQPFENLFHLPVDVEIFTNSGSRVHTVRLDKWTTRISLPAASPPLAVVLDKGNWLVAEIHLRRPLAEVLYLLEHGDLAARLRAARQIVDDFPRRPEGIRALARLLADRSEHWGLRQEAARDLGAAGQEAAVEALLVALDDPDRRVRRAAALALGEAGGERSAKALEKTVKDDAAEEVVAVAAAALGRMHAPGAAEFLAAQLERDSRWWNAIRIGAMMGLAELEDAGLVPTFAAYTYPGHEIDLRLAALDGWFRAAPEDPELAERLRVLARDRTLSMRTEALEKLGALHRREDLTFLNDYAAVEPDPNLAHAARSAAEEIEAFAGSPVDD